MKRWLSIAIPILILLGLIGYRLVQKQAAGAKQIQQRAARMKAPQAVTLATARAQDIVATFEGVGSVEAPLNVKIAVKVTGRVVFLQAREGDQVRAGQVLCRIDPAQIRAQVAQEDAAVAEARYKLAQAQMTQGATNSSVDTQQQQQEAAAASAQANYQQVRENYQSQVETAKDAVRSSAAARQSAQANLDNPRAKYNRMKSLYDKGFIAQQDVDDAKTAVGVAQAVLDSATAQYEAAQHQQSIVEKKGKSDIQTALSQRDQAQAAVRYASENLSQKRAYQQSLAALQAGVDAAIASRQSVQAQLTDTVLTSPMDGFVTGRWVDPGAVVAPGQQIVGVQDMRQVWVSVPVPEEVSSGMTLGRLATVSLDALPGRSFTGRITQVNPSADPQSRQFMVRVTLDNPGNLIKPGTFARVQIETGRISGATVVPREAIRTDPKGIYVLLVDKTNTVHRQAVLVGGADADVIAVTQGIKPGDKVVTMNALTLRDGQKVVTGGRMVKGSKGQRVKGSR